MTIFPDARAVLLTLALGLAAIGLSACGSSSHDSGSDLAPLPQEPTTYKAPPASATSGPPTLGRVVDESRRRRDVIRQLESIFTNPQP